MYMLNYDHTQIIAALNNESLLFKYMSNILLVYNLIKTKPVEYIRSTSLWDDYVHKFDISTVNMMNRNNVINELNEFKSPCKKTNYLKSIIMNYFRQIDYLRASQMIQFVVNNNHDYLIELCCNSQTLINQIIICQNQVHQKVQEMGFILIKDQLKDQFQDSGNNGNQENENKENKENKDDDQHQPVSQPQSVLSVHSASPPAQNASQQQSQQQQSINNPSS